MVKHISIQNFKSIKDLSFEARRINVFIGEPNTGKSNILEAIGMYTSSVSFNEIVRFDSLNNIFFENDIVNEVKVLLDDYQLHLSINNNSSGIQMSKVLNGGIYHFNIEKSGQKNFEKFSDIIDQVGIVDSVFNFEAHTFDLISYSPIKYYKFVGINYFDDMNLKYLYPVYGVNLFEIIKDHKVLREQAKELLNSIGYKLSLRISTGQIEIVKERDDVFYSYPYSIVSDTIQRLIFYYAAIETNQNAILLFEEPEAHTFPVYTKDLAERIVLDESNQYFIVTHNPYLFSTLIQKTPADELNVFITYMEEYQTKLRRIEDHELVELVDLGSSVFLNLDHFLPANDEQSIR